jgi:hypothetical protein
VYKTDLNKGIIQHRGYCSRSLSEQVPLMARLLQDILQTDEAAKYFKTLFWGRLTTNTKESYSDMSVRLALAAARSPLWDAGTGKPVDGHENTVVVRIANDSTIYPELKALFAQFGKDITFSSAEKVIVMEARSLPFFSLLQKHGIEPSDRLPVDCLTWFAVSNV